MTVNNFDVVVIGGGLAGVCASIAAAREGKNVALISNRPVLGGNSSSEIRVWTRGSAGAGNLFSEEMGILGEMKLYNEHINPMGNPILWDEVLFDFVLAEKNINLLLNTFITDVTMGNVNEIISVEGYEVTTENKFELSAKFFIDATGDGAVGAKANVPFSVGKEDETIFGEKITGYNQINTTQGNSILFFTRTENHKVPFIAPKYAYKKEYIEKIINNGGRVLNEHSNGCDLWWVEFGGELDTIKDYAKINWEDKRLTLGIFDYIKNSGKFDADNLSLEWLGNLSGKRESRRFVTDYVVTMNDIINETQFEDVAFYGGWYMDFHPSKGIYSEASFCEQIPVHVYEMPFRCLYNSKVPNLLFAGRDIGSSDVAFASSRVMNTCALSGQAAGTIAAVLVDDKKGVNQIDDITVKKAQQILRNNDMLLLHKAKNDNNLIKNATIVSSDSVKKAFAEKCGELLLDRKVFLAIPSELAKQSKLIVTASEQTEIQVDVSESVLPHSKKFTKVKSSKTITLQKGENAISLGDIYEGKEYLTYLFKENNKVCVQMSCDGLVGVVVGYVGQPQISSPLMSVESFKSYDVENLSNGYNRPYIGANAWVSESVPSQVAIKMDEEKELKQIEFAFNPELSIDLLSSRAAKASIHHGVVYRYGTSPQMVKAFDVYANLNGKSTLIKEVKDNHQRIVKLDLDIKTDEIKIVFKETYGAKRIEVFEIKIN